MTAPAGPCEWCGGPQWWTIVSGVMYVKCQAGCVSLFPEERFNFDPPDGDLEHISSIIPRVMGTQGGTEGVTLEGSDARVNGKKPKTGPGQTDQDLPF